MSAAALRPSSSQMEARPGGGLASERETKKSTSIFRFPRRGSSSVGAGDTSSSRTASVAFTEASSASVGLVNNSNPIVAGTETEREVSTTCCKFRASRSASKRKVKSRGGGKPVPETDLSMSEMNPLQWLQLFCPEDVVPKVLAYCGPQTAAALMKTNRFWYHVMSQEGTWRIMCEELYKWIPGRDDPPASWKSYYHLHPCVPVDYSSIHKALAVASNPRSGRRQPQVRSVHILLRPGKHHVRDSLSVHAAVNAEITVETMQLPKNRFLSPQLLMNENKSSSSKKTVHKASSFRKLLSCSSHAHEEDAVDTGSYDSDNSDSMLLGTRPFMIPMVPPRFPTRAELILRTRRHNEPLFRVTQGTLKLKNVDLHHNSAGIDIWNGNAAVQVQPPMGIDDQPVQVAARPTASLEQVTINSTSGRGIVNIDGGLVFTNLCCVHDCAATGIYVGGPGSQAELHQTDVIRNGLGCRNRRGIGRGHSGVYLEQGVAKITDCNISSNSLTGISAVSPENAILLLEESELISNGSFQLELPPLGTESRRHTVTNSNRMAAVGIPTLKSGLEVPTPHFEM